MSLGEAIRTARQKAFYTQEDFANSLHVALSTVSRWELDKVRPNIKTMKEIKSFCEENRLDYKQIEEEWIGKK